MKLVSEGVNALRDAGRAFLVITHYQRLLDHIKPDVVHIMAAGRIVKTGGPELALEVETQRLCRHSGGGGVMALAAGKAGRAGRADRRAGASRPRAGWARRAAEALARLTAMGLPGKRDEYWRYTDPASADRAPRRRRRRCSMPATKPPVFDGIDRLKLVFVDGVFDAGASDDPALAGVEIERLAEAGAADIHWAQRALRRAGSARADPGGAAAGGAEHGLCHRWRADPGDGQGRASRSL